MDANTKAIAEVLRRYWSAEPKSAQIYDMEAARKRKRAAEQTRSAQPRSA